MQFQDRREAALSRYQEALSLYESTGDHLGKADALTGIGSLQSDPEQALVYFQSAQELYIQIEDRYSQARNLYLFISQAQQQLGDQAAADHSREQALSIAQKLGITTE